MKRCSRCRQLLPISAFTVNRSRRDGLQTNCRDCQRAYLREHYLKNLQYYLEKAHRARKQSVQAMRRLLVELKSVPCADCGGTFPSCAMDFDHRPDEVKSFNVGESIQRGRRAMLAEAAKCEIVCANCHRVRTLQRLLASAHSSARIEQRTTDPRAGVQILLGAPFPDEITDDIESSDALLQ